MRRLALVLGILAMAACDRVAASPPPRRVPAEDTNDAGVQDSLASEESCIFGAHQCFSAQELDRASGSVTGLEDPFPDGLDGVMVSCGQRADVGDVVVSVHCLELLPAGYAGPAYEASVSVTIISDEEHPARDGTVLSFPHHVGIYDDLSLRVRNTGPTLQMTVRYRALIK